MVSLGITPLDSGNIIDSYIMWVRIQQVDLFGDEMGIDFVRYVPYELWIVNDIDEGWCNAKTNGTIGCTKIPKLGETTMGVIQVVQDREMVKSPPGFNVYMHEYLHARCETYAPWANYHLTNEFPVYIGGHDYWNECKPAGSLEDWINNAPSIEGRFPLGQLDFIGN